MTDLRASFTLKFNVNGLTALRRLQDGIGGLRNIARRLEMPGLDKATTQARGLLGVVQRIGRAAVTSARHMGGMVRAAEKLGKSVGPIGALVGFGTLKETTGSYADYDAILRQIAIVEGRSGKQAGGVVGRLGPQFDKLALDTGQSSTDIADAYKWIITTHPGATAQAAEQMADQMIRPLAKAALAYHLNITDIENVPFALQSGFGLKGNQMEAGLAILHRAAMQAHFTMAAFDQELSGLAAQFGSLGTTGLDGLRSVSAMLETVVKVVPSGQPSAAGTDLGDLLTYVTGPTGQARMAMSSRGFSGKMFAQTRALMDRAGIHGFSANAVIAAGSKEGLDPVTSIMNFLHAKLEAIPKTIKGRDREVLQGEVINALFHNQQAAQAARALLLHWDEWHRTQKAIGGAGQGSFDTDFNTVANSATMQMKQMAEGIRQLGRAMGQGFMPVLRAVNDGVSHLVEFMNWADTSFRGTTAWVLGLIGGLILLVSTLGVVGMVAPAIGAGFMLFLTALGGIFTALSMIRPALLLFEEPLISIISTIADLGMGASAVLGPVVGILAIVAAAAYDIYSNWSRFRPLFMGLWNGVKTILQGVGNFVTGVFLGDWKRAGDGLAGIAKGFVQAWSNSAVILKQLLMDLIHWLTGWTANDLARIGQSIESTITAPFHEIEHLLFPGRPAPAPAASAGGLAQHPPGQVLVGVDPANGNIKITHAGPPGVVATAPLDTGHMFGWGGL